MKIGYLQVQFVNNAPARLERSSVLTKVATSAETKRTKRQPKTIGQLMLPRCCGCSIMPVKRWYLKRCKGFTSNGTIAKHTCYKVCWGQPGLHPELAYSPRRWCKHARSAAHGGGRGNPTNSRFPLLCHPMWKYSSIHCFTRRC